MRKCKISLDKLGKIRFRIMLAKITYLTNYELVTPCYNPT